MDTTVAVRGLEITKPFRDTAALDHVAVSAVLGAPVGRSVAALGDVPAGIAVRESAPSASPMFRTRCGRSAAPPTCVLPS